MISRREFVVAGVGAVLARGQAGPAQPTAGDVFEAIKTALGGPWREKTVDGFKAGDPATPVTGVATTVMATVDVLRKASASRRNLIVTREPVFYSGNDEPGSRASDPVYQAKKALIDQHGLVILRLNDHWTSRVPNESVRALARALGWERHHTPAHEPILNVPPTTAGAVARHAAKQLGARGLRLVGSPGLQVRSILLSPGTTDLPTTVRDLPQADLVIAGEPREWEAVPYVLDAAAAGQPKALLALGRIVSEEPGSRACAEWIRTLVPNLPVDAIAVADPFWIAS
jgi:hypothetical protein